MTGEEVKIDFGEKGSIKFVKMSNGIVRISLTVKNGTKTTLTYVDLEENDLAMVVDFFLMIQKSKD